MYTYCNLYQKMKRNKNISRKKLRDCITKHNCVIILIKSQDIHNSIVIVMESLETIENHYKKRSNGISFFQLK